MSVLMPYEGGHHTTANAIPGDIALRLLVFQQRLDALDRLYNEEVNSLKSELTRLKEELVQMQTQPETDQPKRLRRKVSVHRSRAGKPE
jgi:tRNA(Phe) wybutosine-synthesizing methylase Tyw3